MLMKRCLMAATSVPAELVQSNDDKLILHYWVQRRI